MRNDQRFRAVRLLTAGLALALFARGATAQHEGHAGHTTPPPPAGAPLKDEPRVPIVVPAVQQARIGLATARLEHKRVAPTLRTVAVVQVDERREAHVHTRIPGFIDEIFVNAVGQQVRKGQVLYRLYSPELVATQQEYLAARGQGDIGRKVAQAALDRLAAWGVSPRDLAALKQTGTVKRSLAVEAPVSGVVVEKMAVQGIYATPEMHLYRIADLNDVWVVASLYETEIALVKAGDEVTIELPSQRPAGLIHREADARRAAVDRQDAGQRRVHGSTPVTRPPVNRSPTRGR